jgi:hypothetical protein
MLVLHSRLHIPMAHRFHDSGQISRSLQNPRPVVVSAAVENKIFGKSSFPPRLAKPFRHCREMGAFGSFRREDPALSLSGAPLHEDIVGSIAHWHASPPFRCFAVGHEDHAIFPIEIFDTHPVEFSFVSDSGVAHEDDNVLKKLKASFSPVAGNNTCKQCLLRLAIKL